MPAKLLWADDDCERILLGLGWALEDEKGLVFDKAKHFAEAEALVHKATAAGSPYRSLLVDVVLPQSDASLTAKANLGLQLARLAAQNGVERVAFLTVVPLDEVQLEYANLREVSAGIEFDFVNKALLLEPGVIDGLITYLTGA